MMFRRIVMFGKRLNCWNTMPMRSRILLMSISGEVMSVPSKRIVPEVGRSRRFRLRRNVDLPQPDGPMMATTSPSLIVVLMSRSTTWSPKALQRCFTLMSVFPLWFCSVGWLSIIFLLSFIFPEFLFYGTDR